MILVTLNFDFHRVDAKFVGLCFLGEGGFDLKTEKVQIYIHIFLNSYAVHEWWWRWSNV